MSDCGSYKLSEYQLNCLTARYVMHDGIEYQGASSYEIDAVIYFAQICDSRGHIPFFEIQELKSITGCSKRECYQILHSLEEKKIIEVSCNRKNGYRTITLVNNDFSHVKDYRKNRYLNLNRTFLNPYSPDYIYWQNLSLYAKRLLLQILFNYSSKRGYRFKFHRMAHVLKLKNQDLISNYLEEIKPLLVNNDMVTYRSKDKREPFSNPDICFIKRESLSLGISNGLATHQPSYLRFQLTELLDKFIEDGIKVFDENKSLINFRGSDYKRHYIASLSAKLIYLKQKCEGLSIEKILDYFYHYVEEHREFTHLHLIDFVNGIRSLGSMYGPYRDEDVFSIFSI